MNVLTDGITEILKLPVTNVQLLVPLVLKLVSMLKTVIVKLVITQELKDLNQYVHVHQVKSLLMEYVNHVPTNVLPVLVPKVIVILVPILMVIETQPQLVVVMMELMMMVLMVNVSLV